MRVAYHVCVCWVSSVCWVSTCVFGVSTVCVGCQDLEKKADEAPAAAADGEGGIKEEIAQSPSTEATPPPTEMATPATPATPANATDSPAQSMTPIGRVERLEAAMNKDGAGGVIARLTEIEAELLGEKQAGTIPERLQQLEESMGL